MTNAWEQRLNRDLYLERCDGQEDQQWMFKSDGTLRNKMYGENMCLSTGQFYDNVFPQLRPCDGSQYQLETGSNCESTLKIDGKCVYVRTYDDRMLRESRQLLIGDCNDESLDIPGWMTLNAKCNRGRLFANEEDAELTKLEQVLLAEDSEEKSADYISRLFWNWGCDAFHGSTLAMFQPPHCIFEPKRRLQELEGASNGEETSGSERRLLVNNNLVSTGKIYGTATGTLTTSPKLGTYDNAFIFHINMRYNEHLISVQLWSRTLELLEQGKGFIGQHPAGGGMWARTQSASYEVPADNTCINMVRVYSEGQFINGIQWCSRRDGFEYK